MPKSERVADNWKRVRSSSACATKAKQTSQQSVCTSVPIVRPQRSTIDLFCINDSKIRSSLKYIEADSIGSGGRKKVQNYTMRVEVRALEAKCYRTILGSLCSGKAAGVKEVRRGSA